MNRLTFAAAMLSLLSAIGCNGDRKLALSGASEYVTVTADGWALSVLRYRPPAGAEAAPAVVLCHGLGYNNKFWDLAKEVSLAKYLSAAGYDVWVPSLRGAGWSTKPPLSRLRQLFLRGDLLTAGGVFRSAGRGVLKINWTVDDHARHDVPALFDLVTKETGRQKLHWIGHSMGGMILVGHLALAGQEDRLASFVAVGVPVFVIPPLSAPLKQLSSARGAVEISNAIISTNLPSLLGQIAGAKLSGPIEVLFYNRANVTDDVIRRLAAWGTEDISPGQLGQLIDMVAGGQFRSLDGKVDYTSGLEWMEAPALFVAGTVDNLATVGAVKELHARWGAGEKAFALFGAVNGQGSDYGHDDLIIGRQARREVYPAIRRWLDQRTGRFRLDLPLPGLGAAKGRAQSGLARLPARVGGVPPGHGRPAAELGHRQH